MRHQRLLTIGLSLIGLMLPAASAAADTTLLKDDAEGKIEDLWVVNAPEDDRIKPWQKSDSSEPKYRNSIAHGGSTSYWSGQGLPYEPSDVVTGESTMTTKSPILIPADGATTISLWSVFNNEGDDVGVVEAAVATGGKLSWKKVAEYKHPEKAAGDPPGSPGFCDPTDPQMTFQQPWEEVKGSLGAYAGKQVFLRINLKFGAENRSASQPCGWYVDDIALTTTGTPGNAGAAPTTAPPPPATTAPAKPSISVGGLRFKGKKGTLALKVTGGPIKNVKITLLKGKKKVATGKAASLPDGDRKVAVKFKKKARKKTAYTVKITGVAPDGSKFAVTSKTHDY